MRKVYRCMGEYQNNKKLTMKLALIIFMGILLVVAGIAWIALVATKIEREFWSIFLWICYSFGVYFILYGWAALLVKWIEQDE